MAGIMRSAEDIERTIDRLSDTVWRVCGLYFGRTADAQDAFQETFIKYALHEDAFEDEERCKAWLICVARNVCKDMLKAAHRRNVPIDESHDLCMDDTADERHPLSETNRVMAAMRALDDPPRTPVYLALYEGYTAPEIADMIQAPVNTVYSWVARGRKALKEALA